jgi:Clp amino terminal domain, pathogenicity island component
MFERYTEKARRVIFFARYEASHYGSPTIDTEHLLLGLLREDKRISLMLGDGARETIRTQIDTYAPKHESIPTSVDLPLSEAAKRILKYGAEEADRLNHRHIGCEHLLLGLTREEECLAAQVLQPFGANLEQIRKRIEKEGDAEAAPAGVLGVSVRGRLRAGNELIKIHGKLWDASHIRRAVQRCCEYNWHWQKTAWKPRDLSVNRKTGRISLDADLAADTEHFELFKARWKKDNCAICRWELHESDDDHGTGYTNGRDWICTECYDKFWDRPNFISGSFSDLT